MTSLFIFRSVAGFLMSKLTSKNLKKQTEKNYHVELCTCFMDAKILREKMFRKITESVLHKDQLFRYAGKFPG